jgi:hypothetical protein
MLYQTTIPLSKVSKEKVINLATAFADMVGSHVEVEECLMISTDDAEISSMFDSLASSISNGNGSKPEPKPRKKQARKEKTVDGPKAEPTRGPHVRSISRPSTNEMISRFMLNKMLEEKTVNVGELLHSPKFGAIRVDVRDGKYIVVNDQGVQV